MELCPCHWKCDCLEQYRKVLSETRLAINPTDIGGISLHEWNGRLKAATKAIDAVLDRIPNQVDGSK